jgi:methionyl-tRNA formyltransferase
MSTLRVIFMGSPAFALPILRALLGSRHQVVAAYSQPPRPAGRGQKLRHTPVAELAATHHIPVVTPISLKVPQAQDEFAAYAADVAIVAAYGLLLPPPILAAPRAGCINIHPSALPRWRGAAPIQRTLMAGDRHTACCLMLMDQGLDTGAILARREVTIADGTDAGMLEHSMAELGAVMVLEYMEQLAHANAPEPQPQASEGVTYAAKLTKEELQIDWSRPAEYLRHQILGLAPIPAAYSVLAGERMKIFRAETMDTHTNTAPGTVLTTEQLTIQCGGGTALCLREMQRPGHRRTTAEEIVNSLKIQPGDMFSSTAG